ncbi:MAG: M24 family metallopeptidase [Nitrospira sp.]
MTFIPPNHSVQLKAKEAMSAIAATISVRSTEQTIAATAKKILGDFGLTDTWYYDCPAFVLLGSRSCLSLSGRDYIPAMEPVGTENIVTIDLSPCEGKLWGDYARSLCIEHGRVVEEPTSSDFCDGLRVERELHRRMADFVTPDTSFHQLYEFANDAIATAGYDNLDFLGNVGHSIETRRENRLYVEKGNHRRLSEVSCFTFEPHIRRNGGRWGFKHEDIYYFDHGCCIAV